MTFSEIMSIELQYQLRLYLHNSGLEPNAFAIQSHIPQALIEKALNQSAMTIRELKQLCLALHITVEALRTSPPKECLYTLIPQITEIASSSPMEKEVKIKAFLEPLDTMDKMTVYRNLMWLLFIMDKNTV